MSSMPFDPSTQIILTLCQRRMQEVMTSDEPLLNMLVKSGELLPMEIAEQIEQVANIYFRAAGEIRRRHYSAARPAAHSPSAQTSCRVVTRA